jgi:hypothetical protein
MNDFVDDEQEDCVDEDEESSALEAELNRPKKNELSYKLTIEGLTEQDIVNVAVQRLTKKVEAAFTKDHEQQIKVAIEESVTAAVQRIVETRLDAEINKIIDEGWEERGKWGEKTGNRFSLAQKVTEFLREKVDSYGSSSRHGGIPRATRLMQKAVEDLFAKELKGELEDAKKRVKQMVDAEVMARLSKTLKDALGLS